MLELDRPFTILEIQYYHTLMKVVISLIVFKRITLFLQLESQPTALKSNFFSGLGALVEFY